jgi:hypothetical protein
MKLRLPIWVNASAGHSSILAKALLANNNSFYDFGTWIRIDDFGNDDDSAFGDGTLDAIMGSDCDPENHPPATFSAIDLSSKCACDFVKIHARSVSEHMFKYENEHNLWRCSRGEGDILVRANRHGIYGFSDPAELVMFGHVGVNVRWVRLESFGKKPKMNTFVHDLDPYFTMGIADLEAPTDFRMTQCLQDINARVR